MNFFKSRDARNAIGCVLICTIALLAAWPFSGLAFNDDWSWSLTVKRLVETGHLHYNGWSSPSVIAQAYWGWIWVKLFGFSFNVLRVSSLPMAAGTIAMCYALARRAGLPAPLAVFVTLTLGLSPVFMPLESTFMTDVPGLFFMLVSMYALVRGFETLARTRAIGWLFIGACVALIGGSSRQIVWIVPLVVLPYVAWLRRVDWAFVLASGAGWLMVLTGVIAMQHWFALQPYSLPDPPAMAYLREGIHHPTDLALGCVYLMLTLVLLMMPAGLLIFRRRNVIEAAVAIGICAPLVLGLLHFKHLLEPWMGNIVTSTGPLGSIEIAGGRPQSVPNGLRLALSLAAFAIGSMMLSRAAIWIVRQGRLLPEAIWSYFLISPRSGTSNAAVPMFILTAIALIGLEMTRIVFLVAYDRHLLPLIPFLLIPFLSAWHAQGVQKMPRVSWILLGVFGLYGLAATQEVNALARARVMAIKLLNAHHISDEQIEAGFEHNYWTQAERAGHVNDVRIENPVDGYDRTQGPTPVMRVEYRLESSLQSDTQSTDLGPVDYFSLLPPFHRRIYIDRFKDPWWLDARAATRPVNRGLLPPALLNQYKH